MGRIQTLFFKNPDFEHWTIYSQTAIVWHMNDESVRQFRNAPVSEAQPNAADQLSRKRLEECLRQITNLLKSVGGFDGEFFWQVAKDKRALMGRNIATTINIELGDKFSQMQHDPDDEYVPVLETGSNEARVQLAQSVQLVLQSMIDLVPIHSGHEPSKVSIRDPGACEEAFRQLIKAFRGSFTHEFMHYWKPNEDLLNSILQAMYKFWKRIYVGGAI